MEKKKYIQAIFCSPTGKFEDQNLNNRLTDEVFSNLKSIGINRIFGYCSDDRDETIRKTFEFCDKYDIYYLPTPKVKNHYVNLLKEKGKRFIDLTDEEIKTLDEKLINEINEYKKYKSFKGVFFEDEVGYLSFPGLIHAKKVFDENFKGYEFHYNFYSYSINRDLFLGGQLSQYDQPNQEIPFTDEDFTFENRFKFYDYLVEGLLSNVNFEFLSVDKYPYEYWGDPVYHQGMFDLPPYFYTKKMKYGSKFYNYMQVGQWFRESDLSFEQVSLNQHISACYGCDGFAYFPGCFPIDWANYEGAYIKAKRGGSSLIDLDGNPTIYLEYYKKLYHSFFKAIEDDILSSKLIKSNVYGKFDNGLTKEYILNNLDWSESVYVGDVSEYMKGDFDEIKIESSNQILISKFSHESGLKRYYIVNTQTEKEVDISIDFDFKNYEVISINGSIQNTGTLKYKLSKGEGIYIKEI